MPTSEDRYEVTPEDKSFGPPNAERRGLNRILVNSSIAAGVLALAGLIYVW